MSDIAKLQEQVAELTAENERLRSMFETLQIIKATTPKPKPAAKPKAKKKKK